jgi:uncharacterized protein YndB with AHSA1/START domain
VDVTRWIDAPAAAVWTQLAETRHWPAWGPTVAAVDPADATVRPGLRGTVRTPVGVELPFEVTAVEPGRRWAWEVAGVTATDHLVEPDGDGCTATIRIPSWAPFYAPVCALALRRIASRARDSTSST